MSGYPRGDVLLAKCRAGRGKIVIVEGEADDQDPYFYRRWFDAHARSLTFLPQNGCSQVIRAVEALRAEMPTRQIFGIRDRDFGDDDDLVAQDGAFPADGVLRPNRYTLENYLLEAEGWFEVVKLVHRGALPPGWDSVAAVREQVLCAYRHCLPVSAFNVIVKREYERLQGDRSGIGLGYRPHPNAVTAAAVEELDAWGEARGAPAGLRGAYEAELATLRAASIDAWQRRVTGKAVLKVFHASFPGVHGGRLLDNLYLDKHPTPPADLDRLIQRVLAAPWR